MMRLSSRPAWMLAVLLLGTNLFAAEPVAWETNFERAQQLAAQSNRLVLLHFGAAWCGPCKWMDAEVFSRPEVDRQIQANFVPVKIEADQNPALAVRYGVDRLPADVVVTPQGQLVSVTKGKMDAAQYVARLNQSFAIARQRNAALVASIPPTAAVAVNTNPPAITPPANYQPLNNSPLATITTAPAVPDPTTMQPPMLGPSAGPSLDLNGPANAALPPQVAQPATMPNPGVANPGAANPPAMANYPPASNANINNATAPLQNPPSVARANLPPREVIQPPLSNPVAQPNPPIALDGFCPVSLAKKWQWVPGDKRWGAFHQGRTYLFAGPEEQSQFLANGNYERYAPVASGNDIVLAVEQQKTVPGRREFGVSCNGHIFLFSSAETRQKFESNSHFYLGRMQGVPHQAASTGQQPPR